MNFREDEDFNDNFNENTKIKKNKENNFNPIVVVLVCFFLVFILFVNTAYVVKNNQYGVIKEFGKIIGVKGDAGLYFKLPFIQNIQIVDKRQMLYDVAKSDVITKDKKSLISDSYVVYKVNDPKKYLKTLNGIDERARERIEASTYNGMKQIISSMTQDEVIKSRGNELTRILTESVEEEFVESDDDKLQIVVINAGVHKYLDILIETKGIFWASDIIKKYGRNKDLDYFIENTNDFFTLSCIANVGRNKDLDMLTNSTSNLRVIDSIIKNGRKKDIKRHILDDYFSINIVKTGINEYLDFFVTKEIAHNLKLHIINVGRKKDLSLFLKHKDSNLDYEIIKHGFDDHLDYLSKNSNEERVLESVLQFHRKCDYDIIKARGYKIDDDVCDENLLW